MTTSLGAQAATRHYPTTHRPDDAELPEFLLYPTPSGADHDLETEPALAMIRGVGRNLAAICGLFFVSLAAFIVCTVLFSVGVSLAILVGGLFVLVACLIVAGWRGSGDQEPARATPAWTCRRRCTRRPSPGSEHCDGCATPSPGATSCTCS